VAQMVPGSAASSAHPLDEQENVAPSGDRILSHRDRAAEKASMKGKGKELPPKPVVDVPQPAVASSMPPLRINGFDVVAETLTAALDAKAAGRLFRDPRADADLPYPKVFIVSWLDYANKYGMGYATSDGSVGVHFNDSTSLILSPDKSHFDYVTSRRQGIVYVRKNYTISQYPDEIKNKVYLLKYFEQYIMERLYNDTEYTYEDVECTRGMAFVQKYLRIKNVILFKMSHDVLQFNFYDHSKVILSSRGLHVTHIDKDSQMSRWSLSEIMAQALRPPVADPVEAKFHQRLVDKLKYCREVLVSLRQASAIIDGEQGEPLDVPMPRGGLPTMSTRTSKSSMRS